MMLLVAGVSHKTSPLAVRERLAVQDSELVAVARSLKSHLGLDEIVLVSTCNRVEIYEIARAAGLTGVIESPLSESFSGGEGDSHSHRDWSRRCLNRERGGGIGEKNFEDDLAGRSIMVIGAGHMAECCVRLLVKKGARSILISNRSLDRALRWSGPAVMPPKGMLRQRP
jgi:glutamyl-tRNA reductase